MRRRSDDRCVALFVGVALVISACTTVSTVPASTPPAVAVADSAPSSTMPPASHPPPPPPAVDIVPDPPRVTPTSTSTSPPTEQQLHDRALAPLLDTLGRQLQAGRSVEFLTAFAPSLTGRVGRWFTNTVALGVAAVRFAPADDYFSGATDSANGFSRTVVLGIRTPYDETTSMPGIPYRIDVAISSVKGKAHLTVTGWRPEFLGDPMDCDCKLGVVHSGTVAVVFAASDPDLAFWSTSALEVAQNSVAWTDAQLAGSGLVAPRGQVIFLADQPFHWFLGTSGPAQETNVTVPLSNALGAEPGSNDSPVSRIVVMLLGSDGVVIPNDREGREYFGDVVAHESTHQLMNRNSELPYRADGSPPVWAVEGIAVAVETLHRDAVGSAENFGYPEPNNPANIDPAWFRAHLSDTMPSRSQVYSPSATDSAGYYALSGSVFRYLDAEYGYAGMMAVAKALYAKLNQNPFTFFPDPAHPGGYLTAAVAEQHWKDWFTHRYLV